MCFSFLEICQLSIVFNEPVIVQYTMLESIFEIVQTDKLSLYYELVNIYNKYGEKRSFKFFSCFLKNRGLLKGFEFIIS